MLPLRDHNPSERKPFVTWVLIAINIGVFLSYFPSISEAPSLLMAFYADWALVPAQVSQGDQTYTIFTSMFLHGGWMHLAGNMLFLWIFGDNLEDQMGHLGYLVFYLAAGVAAAFGQMIANPYSPVPMVGASGAIAGVMGGYLLMFPRARVDFLLILFVFFRVITVPAWLMLGLWFGMQLVNGAAADTLTGGVAYWAHAGGFIAGVVLAVPVWLRRGGPAFWNATHGHPPHEEAFDDRAVSRPRRARPREVEPTATTRIPRTGQGRRPPPSSPWGGRR